MTSTVEKIHKQLNESSLDLNLLNHQNQDFKDNSKRKKKSIDSSKPKRLVGNYALINTLGSGSMGKVRLAINNLTGDKLAVKIVPRQIPKEKQNKKQESDECREIRTIREASIMLLLHHPFIVSLKEMTIFDSSYYLFMEYVNGGQLLDYIISHGKLREKQARRFARQIASALDYCHRNSIVHRDLKIENILISQSGNIKIIDFGLSNLFSARSSLKTFCGSLYFAAPELLNAKAYTGPEVDVWSFGVVLYVLVCGRVPFDDQNMPALHEKIKRGVVDYPSHLSTECKSILSRMLVINPVHRATVSELTIHPWLNKGYDTPVDNYLPDRTPLTLPVDMEVVRGMTGFEFGTEIEIKEKLELIITSEEYQKAAKTLFDRTVESHRQLAELSLSSKYISNNTQRRPPNDDPQSIPAAYHPLISIYYLVKERLERERRSLSIESTKEAQFTGTYTTQDLQKQSVDVTSEKKESKSTVRRLSYAFPDKNNHDTKANEISSSASTPLQIPASQHKKNKSVSKAFEPASKFANDALFTPPQQTEPTDLEIATAAAAAAAALSSNQSKFGNRLSKILPRRMTLGQNSMNAENHTQFLNIVHANHQLKLQNDLKQRKKPIEDEEDEQSDLGLTTTRSFSKASPPKQQPFPAGTLDHQKGMADENVKPVFLKGLFSVTTTTTKCPSIIRADLIRVLERIGVKWRESQGRFECVHLPSINLHVVTQEESPDVPSDEVAKIPVPDLVVRFEIYIVKVPWLLGMHGLQFRRVGGDPWQYKNMCSKILTELKL